MRIPFPSGPPSKMFLGSFFFLYNIWLTGALSCIHDSTGDNHLCSNVHNISIGLADVMSVQDIITDQVKP